MADIQHETLAELREGGVEDLLVRHFEEISHYPDIPLDVDWPAYEAAETAGKFRLVTIREGEKLAGYISYFVNRNPHYQSSVQAVQDVLFIAPEHRGGALGYRMIAHADQALAAEGVQCVYQHQKIAHPALGHLLEKLGYEPIEVIWAKRLDRNKG